MHSNGTVPLPESRNGYNDFLIKTEPESGGSTPACLQSPPLSGNSTFGSKAPPSSLSFTPSSGSSNGRTSRNFSTPDAKRKCRGDNSRTSPMFSGKDEMEDDDLKLNPDDFLSTVIRTPPIKPLEEGDDPPITPSPTSVGPPTRRCPSNPPTNNSCTSNHSNSNHSNPPSTPTAGPVGPGSSNGINSNSNSSKMDEDLNEFYRVMEQVCEKQNRLSSTVPAISTSGATSTQIDMYSSVSPPIGTSGTSQHPLLSPPPYNPTSSVPQTAPSGPRYCGGAQQQHLHAVLTSPPAAGSPPFSTAAYSLFNTPLQGQCAPSSSLTMQQSRQPPPLQPPTYPPGAASITSSQVDMSLQFSDPSLLSQPAPPQTQHSRQATQQQQQLQAAVKPQNQPEVLPHQQMHLSHLNQHREATRQVVAPAPLNIPITSHVYYNSSQTQRIMHTSATSLPPQPPLTPTTPLEHFATFPTTQSSQISPTHQSSPFHHQGLPGPAAYTYSPETSHFLSNHVQNPYHQSPQRQVMQQSSAITVSTNSWGGHRQMPRLAYKDNMMVQHAVGRTHMNSLVRPQRPGPVEASLASYPQLRMGHPTLQRVAPPPAYLQSCGSNSHPNAVAFRLSFPPSMQ